MPMQPSIRVAAVQMSTEPLASNANRAKVVRLPHDAASAGAELAVFPELCNTGYLTGARLEDREALYRAAETIPGPTTEDLGQVGRDRNIHLVVGLAERDPRRLGVLHNTAVLLNNQGRIVGLYRKVHCAAEEKFCFHPGAGASAYQTELGSVGLMICYDSLFPELARRLALQGADLVCVPFNWVRVGDFTPGRLKRLIATRALENRTYFIGACKVGRWGDDLYLGASVVAGPSGEVLAEASSQEEEVVIATLQRDVLLRERLSWTPLRDRRPEAYGEQIG